MMIPNAVNAKTVMVTGGAGFIGSHLISALLAQGVRVINVDNFNNYYDPAIKHANVAPFKALYPELYHEYVVDICDDAALADVFKTHGASIDSVVHLAAWAGVRPSFDQPELYLKVNVEGTQKLLELMKTYGVSQMVFASSSSVYGHRTDPPFREDQDTSKPISVYAATKQMAETLLHTYAHLWGMNIVALRFFTVYGPAQRPDLAIHKFTRLMSEGNPIPVYGDGSALRDFTYIDDIIQGVVAAMNYAKPGFDVFNLGESQSIRLSALIEQLATLLGVEARIESLPPQPGDVPMTCADISKARDILGYTPTTTIEQGLPLFVAWYRQWAGASRTANKVMEPVLERVAR